MIVSMMQHLLKNVLRNPSVPLRISILMLAILAYGSTGFLYFELPGNPDLSWMDGIWYTVVTMTTVGYGDFFPKTAGGRFLVGWPVMTFGIGLLGYALSVIAAALVTSKTKEIKGMSSFTLSGHLVIINFAGVAKVTRILDELARDSSMGKNFAVVLIDERLEELPAELQNRGVHYVRGNPTRDETLVRAGVDQAGHAVVLSRDPADPASDSLNIAITLAIEGRSHKVKTVVECIDSGTEELLKKAGCDRIVCTSRFDAQFLSQELLNPGIQEVMDDLLSSQQGQQLYLTQVNSTSSFADIAIKCLKHGHMAIGVSSQNGIRLNPPPDTEISNVEMIVTIGPERIPVL